ncbi:MAG: fibronectin/fibrinogen-binding protein [Lachnospiraceae bacterium]|nr:fibronectin/fibrinogen-binding protein [Lachnospiraceae bacterium]
MAFDGIVTAAMAAELREKLTDARIYKIAQPENDELLFTLKNNKEQHRLAISASASLPFIYLTKNNKPSPMTAPNFCMLLRKHIQNGRIVRISQPGLERVLDLEIEHLNDLGDLCTKHLMVELMGKHSNIIFCDGQGHIIDSIKHVSAQVSSVREVLPGRDYFIPETMHKQNPLAITEQEFCALLTTVSANVSKALYTTLTGISPVMAEEVCTLAGIESAQPANTLSENERLHLSRMFLHLMDAIRDEQFAPVIIYREDEPVEFSALPLTQYADLDARAFDSISQVLETYYADKNAFTRIRQKSADLRRIVQTALERNRKKYDLQAKQLRDTEKREKYKVYGELINTYGYSVKEGASSFEALNYYTNETITIPLDHQLTTAENAQKYFQRYNKLKRTYEALTELIQETKDEITHLESVSTALDIAVSEDDLVQIKEELMDCGYIRRKYNAKKVKITSRPFHYISSDGYHIYVGKNNLQNEDLTFKFAVGNDWWFHAKGIPGSHVIVRTNGDEIPDSTFEEAGRLAAYYSKGRGNEKVEIDYTLKKNVKKPNGSKPGFVVYYTNYSLVIDSDIQGIEEL